MLWIKPLRNKYYGTVIQITDGPLTGNEFTIWYTTGNPSDRQLEQWGLTRGQWDKDELVDNGFGGKSKISEMDYICDSHYESQETYEFAKKLCEKV